MALNLGELAILLSLDRSRFSRDLSGAQQDMSGLSGSAQRAVRDVETGTSGVLKKVAGFAKDALKTAGVVFTTAAGTATGLVIAAGRAGIAYNGMQQASRAALTTILGGAQAANDQMDKLDAFARTSPFAKQVFITAQQQLLGFGLQAQKVVPTLQAIQDAVAAVGGSNQDITNITYALAQIMGQGKLTGDTLNQLGQYGINAADIIGKQMGKTADEIRDMASKPGGIPADKVFDPLVKGMTDRFGGAAANVKETWAGATDRIKGAWRDIGSAIAEPFVGHAGGGMAIVWVNQFADLMRAVQAKVTPVVDVIIGRLMPAFDKISPTLVRARSAVTGFDVSSINSQLDKLSKYAPLIAGVAGSLSALGGNAFLLSRLGISLNPVVAGVLALVAASPELRGVLKDFLSSLSPLLPVVEQLGGQIAGILMSAIRDLSPVLSQVLQAIAPVIVAFASGLPPVVGAAGAVLAALVPVLKVAAVAITGIAKALKVLGPVLPTVLAGLLAYRAVGVVMAGVTTGLSRMAQGAAMATYSMSGPLGGAAGAASGGLSRVAGSVTALGKALPVLGLAAVAVGSMMQASSNQMDSWAQALLNGGKAAAEARKETQHFQDVSQGGLGSLHSWGDAWDRAKALTMGYTDAADDAKKKAKELYDAMPRQQQVQQDVTKATNDLAEAQKTYGYGSAQAQGAAEALVEAQARQKKVQDDLAKATKTATDRMAEQAAQALGQANAQLAVEQATVSVQNAQDDYNKVLADSSSTAGQRAEAERGLRQAMLDAAQAAAQKSNADNAGKSDAEKNALAIQAQITLLDDFIAKAGKDAPQAIIDYRNQLTKAAADADATKKAIGGVRGAIVAVPGEKSIIVRSLTDEAKAALIALGGRVEKLPDGRIKVTAATAAAQAAIDELVNRNKFRQLPINVKVGGVGANYARAKGGPVWPGPSFLVGEHGPEIVRFAGSGTVIPADRTAQMLAGNRQAASAPAVAAPAAPVAVADRAQQQVPTLHIDRYYEAEGSSARATAEELTFLARTRPGG